MEKTRLKCLVYIKKNHKGITLIVLVITIIIMLILAGATISMAINGGLVEQANKATRETDIAITREQIQTDILTAILDKGEGITEADINNILKKYTSFGLGRIEAGTIIFKDLKTLKGNEFILKDMAIFNTAGKISPNITTLEAGDYINYSPGTGVFTMTTADTGYTAEQTYNVENYKGTWQILYNGGANGVQIISTDSVGRLTIGSITSQDDAKRAYNNFVGTLNKMCGNYVNPRYAISPTAGRCVGSLPSDNSTSQGNNVTNYTNDWAYFSLYNNTIVQPDTSDISDRTAMQNAGIMNIGDSYWLATRRINAGDINTGIFGRCVLDSGDATAILIWLVDGSGVAYPNGDSSQGVRPVITLKPNLGVVDNGGRVGEKVVWDLVY